MQSFSSPPTDQRPRLLVVELWGVGDVAMAIPFLRATSRQARVTLLAKPHAAPLLARFCPEVELLPFHAPWTAFRDKYQLHRWPWLEFSALARGLRHRRFAAAVSARPDPRDHALMALAGAQLRIGFPRIGSSIFLNHSLDRPTSPHRFAYWQAAAEALNGPLPESTFAPRLGKHVVIHTGAAQPTRRWASENFVQIADRLRAAHWQVTLLDEHSGDLSALLETLATADRFIGNDSGPGHLAALTGIPTFSIFGAQHPENFHPLHPRAAWIEGAPCEYKPCHDSCRFAEPHCIRSLTVDAVWSKLASWLSS